MRTAIGILGFGAWERGIGMFKGMAERHWGLERMPGQVGLDLSSYSGSGSDGEHSLDAL